VSPLQIERVVHVITEIVLTHETGLFHLGGEREMSYFEFAKEYFGRAGFNEVLIKGSLAEPTQQTIFNSLQSNV